MDKSLRSEFSDLSQLELGLIDSLGINPNYFDLYDLVINKNGWLSARVDKKHIAQNELGPIPIAEAMRYMGISGKLTIQSHFSNQSTVYAITRCCKIARAIDLHLSSNDQSFVVKSKLVESKGDICRVSTRLEDLNGALILFAYFEFHLTIEDKPLNFNELIESGTTQLFNRDTPIREDQDNPTCNFNHECVSDIKLNNLHGSGITSMALGGVADHYFYKRRYYPSAFIMAALATLASRLAAGKKGKRYYSYSVKYIEIHNFVLVDMNKVLKLECDYIELASDVDVIRGKVLDSDKEVFMAEIGLSVI